MIYFNLASNGAFFFILLSFILDIKLDHTVRAQLVLLDTKAQNYALTPRWMDGGYWVEPRRAMGSATVSRCNFWQVLCRKLTESRNWSDLHTDSAYGFLGSSALWQVSSHLLARFLSLYRPGGTHPALSRLKCKSSASLTASCRSIMAPLNVGLILAGSNGKLTF